MKDFLINILASAVSAVLAFCLGWSLRRLSERRALAHVLHFIGKNNHVKIVVPGSRVLSFTIRNEDGPVEARVPTNVLSMGMSEGQAIAELMSAIHRVSPNTRVEVVPAPHFSDDGTPFISIGGPSINVVSRRYTSKFFPSFAIKYPEHVAGWSGSMVYKPKIIDNELIDDYGFVFFGKTEHSPFILIFGVWTFGTLIATKCFLSLRRGSEPYKRLSIKHHTMLATYGEVSTYSVDNCELHEAK